MIHVDKARTMIKRPTQAVARKCTTSLSKSARSALLCGKIRKGTTSSRTSPTVNKRLFSRAKL
jgi:hypothetical protein